MQYFSEIMAEVGEEKRTKASTMKPTLEVLTELQLKYVHSVVYSNLDIIVGRKHSLVPKNAYDSVVINNEGGTCLTINLAFYYILKKIGFKAHLVAPLVLNYNERKQKNDRPTHMAIRVKIDKKMYLVDPGWGNSSRTPVYFTGEEAIHPMGTFRLTNKSGLMFLEKKFDTWVPQFTFRASEKLEYSDFNDLMEFICKDDSVFRKTLFVTKATDEMCIALIDDKFHTTFTDGTVKEDSVLTHGGISVALTKIFGLSEEYIGKVEWAKDQIVEGTYLMLAPKWNKLFIEVFEENALRFPDKTAVTDENRTLNYKELNEEANRLAHYLINQKQKPQNGWANGDCVGLFLENSVNAIVSILAIMKSGLAFVPLPTNEDANYTRIKEYYIDGSKLRCIIVTEDKKSNSIFSSIKNDFQDKLEICYFEKECKNNHVDNPNQWVEKKQLAYIIFSSGSTGPAKGIETAHKGLLNAAMGIVNTYDQGQNKCGDDEKFGSNASLLFDASIVDILAPLSIGASSVVVPHRFHTDAIELNKFLRKHEITRISLVPATLELLKIDPSLRLRGIISTGEKAHQALFDKIFESAIADNMKIDLWNGYGPAEATIVTSLNMIMPGKPILIGTQPIKGLKWYILEFDREGVVRYPESPERVKLDEEGELYLSGENLGLGYVEIKGEEKPHYHSRYREIRDPDDHNRWIRIFQTDDIVKETNAGLEFIGRVDEQIKYFGELIYLGAIENAIMQFKIEDKRAFEKVKVVGENSTYNNYPLLIVYVKSVEGIVVNELHIRQLRHFLKDHKYNTRVPSRFCLIENWPTLPNSIKTDVSKLKSRITKTLFCTSPFNLMPGPSEQEVTEIIRKIWREVLDTDEKCLPNLSIDSSFYELGGDSVRVFQMLNAVKHKYGPNTPDISQFNNYPTIRALVFRVTNGNNPDIHPIEWKSRKPKNLDLFNKSIELRQFPIILVNSVSGECRTDFHCIIEPIRRLYPSNHLLSTSAISLTKPGYRVRSLEELARDYVASIDKDDLLSTYQGPLIFIGYSTGGNLAYEIACQYQIADKTRFIYLVCIDSMGPSYYRNLDQSAYAKMLIDMIEQMVKKYFITLNVNINELPIKHLADRPISKQVDLLLQYLTEHLDHRDVCTVSKSLGYISTIHNMIGTLKRYQPKQSLNNMALISFSESVERCRNTFPEKFKSEDMKCLLWPGSIESQMLVGDHIDFVIKENWVDEILMPELKTILDHAVKRATSTVFNELNLKLKQSYQAQGKIDRIMVQDEPLPIESSFINLVILREQEQKRQEANLKEPGHDRNTILESYVAIQTQKEPIEIKDLLNQEQNKEDKERHLMVNGRASIGKSTFCKYIAHQWSVGKLWSQEFEWVFWIPLRTLTIAEYPEGHHYDHLDIIKISCLDRHAPNAIAKKHDPQLEAIRKVLHQSPENVLILLDGYDELNWSSVPHLQEAFTKLMKLQNIILTTRPNYAVPVGKFRTKLEITGFSNENIEAYVHYFYKTEPVKARSLMAFLKANTGVWGIAHVPINLELLCCVWIEHEWQEEAPTMTEIYQRLEEWLLKRDYERDHFWEEKKFWELEEHYKLSLSILRELAYKAMRSGIILLEENKLASCSSYRSENKKNLLRLGLLKQTESSYHFIHLTFQEFFAAKQIANIISNGNHKELEDLKEFIKFNKYDARYEIMWWFVAGLLKDKLNALQQYFDFLMAPPRDLLGWVDISLLLRCLEESGLPDWLKQKHEILAKVTKYAEVSCNYLLYYHERNKYLKEVILLPRLSISKKVANQAFAPTLLKRLEDSDLGDRIYVAKMLVTLNHEPPEVIAVFIKVCEYIDLDQEQNPAVRSSARKHVMSMLGELNHAPTEIIAWLIKVLMNSNSDKVAGEQATSALVQLGKKSPEVISALIKVLMNLNLNSYVEENATSAPEQLNHAPSEDIVALIKALDDNCQFVRIRAAFMLVTLKQTTQEVTAVLIKLLGDSNSEVKWKAAHVLGKLKQATPETIAALINALVDSDSRVKREVASALWNLNQRPPELITALIKELEDKEWNHRRWAMTVLGKLDNATPKVIEALINVLREDSVPDIRLTAARTLGKIKQVPRVVIVALIKALEDPCKDVRLEAISALVSLNQAIPEVISALINALAEDRNGSINYAKSALMQLVEKKPSRVVAALIKALSDKNWEVSMNAESVLKQIKHASPKVIAMLIKAMEDPDLNLQLKVVPILKNLKLATPEVITAFIKALGNDRNGTIRCYSANALAELNQATPDVIDALINALKDLYPSVVKHVAYALVELGNESPEVVTALIEQLNMNDSSYHRKDAANWRIDAASTLGKLKQPTPEVISALIKALKDLDSDVRITAACALVKLGNESPEVVTALMKVLKDLDSDVRINTACALVKLGKENPEVVTVLIEELKGSNSRVRLTKVASSLVELGNRSTDVITALIELLENSDSYDRIDVASILWKLKQPTPQLISAYIKELGSCWSQNISTIGAAWVELYHQSSYLELCEAIDPKIAARGIIRACQWFYVYDCTLFFKIDSSVIRITLSPNFRDSFLNACTTVLKEEGYPLLQSPSHLAIEKNQNKVKQTPEEQPQKSLLHQRVLSKAGFFSGNESAHANSNPVDSTTKIGTYDIDRYEERHGDGTIDEDEKEYVASLNDFSDAGESSVNRDFK